MKPMKKMALFAASALLALAAQATPGAALPYDEQADARAELQSAQAAAKAARLPLLIVFGANWCEDCRALDKALKSEANAALMARSFKLLKVDVGRFNKNTDIAQDFGNPIKKGIPAAVLVSPDGALLYATRAGELADARGMSESGIYDFFHGVASKAANK